ncbi:2S seed storage protein 1-like [Andrographis paniculata]|uniref:2S seed storage protein 1-like n=1 Tax=Andrographis paniculata TaxID=175694 RepID=UPI0021E6FD5F|nr:2S seed storage protein 1-like [Andrographis paniculata]
MATKFVVLAALLAALVACSSAYTTVVTTTTVEEADMNPQQSCEKEMQRFQTRKCMRYLQSSRMETETPFLRSAVADPGQQEQELEECCNELRSVSSPCRCRMIKETLKEMQKQPHMEEEGKEEAWQMKQKAESLPRRCGFRSPTHCRISTIFI